MLSALGVLSTEHSVQSNPSALSALSTEMHHQNKTLSTKCCHPHGHSVLSTSTVCAPDGFLMNVLIHVCVGFYKVGDCVNLGLPAFLDCFLIACRDGDGLGGMEGILVLSPSPSALPT